MNPELRDHLAAQYVLGTLAGPARRRMEKIMMEDWRAREAVWHWETMLAPLLEITPPVRPAPHCQKNIELRLFGPAQKSQNRYALPGWIAALTACIVAVTLVVSQPSQTPAPQLLAAIAQLEGDAQWSFRTDADFTSLSVRPISATTAIANSDYELWAIAGNGTPLSLGVIKGGAAAQQVSLSASQREALEASGVLAVSLEPAGGSPTGLPTGPVLYTAKFVML